MKVNKLRRLFINHNFELKEITNIDGSVLVIAEPLNPSATTFQSPRMSTRKAAYTALLDMLVGMTEAGPPKR